MHGICPSVDNIDTFWTILYLYEYIFGEMMCEKCASISHPNASAVFMVIFTAFLIYFEVFLLKKELS
jgi:hypothetical protein